MNEKKIASMLLVLAKDILADGGKKFVGQAGMDLQNKVKYMQDTTLVILQEGLDKLPDDDPKTKDVKDSAKIVVGLVDDLEKETNKLLKLAKKLQNR